MTVDQMVGKKALFKLEELLGSHPQLNVERTDHSVTVKAADSNGFDVTLSDEGSEVIIFAGGWHDHIDDPEEAASTFMWLLTTKVRIVLTYRGKTRTSWKIQWDENGTWTDGSRGTFLLAFLFRGPRSEVVLQNNLLAGPA